MIVGKPFETVYTKALFDLDGTLVDSGPGITRSCQYALKQFGIEVEDPSSLRFFVGPPLTQAFPEFFGFDEEQTRQAIVYYRQYYRDKGLYESKVYDGIPELLASMRRRGIACYVATSKPEFYAKQVLEYHGILDSFDFVSGAMMNEGRGRKEETINFLLEHENVTNKKECLMIGDTKFDAIGAAACGLDCLGVSFGFGTPEDLLRHGALAVAETPAEILENVPWLVL